MFHPGFSSTSTSTSSKPINLFRKLKAFKPASSHSLCVSSSPFPKKKKNLTTHCVVPFPFFDWRVFQGFFNGVYFQVRTVSFRECTLAVFLRKRGGKKSYGASKLDVPIRRKEARWTMRIMRWACGGWGVEMLEMCLGYVMIWDLSQRIVNILEKI